MFVQVEIEVPTSWAGEEVWLHWVSQAEALLWTKDGEPLQVRFGGLRRCMLLL